MRGYVVMRHAKTKNWEDLALEEKKKKKTKTKKRNVDK